MAQTAAPHGQITVVCRHVAAGAPVVGVVECEEPTETDSGTVQLCVECVDVDPFVLIQGGMVTLCTGCLAERQRGVG